MTFLFTRSVAPKRVQAAPQPLHQCYGAADAGFGLFALGYPVGHGPAMRAAVAIKSGFGLGPGGEGFGQLVLRWTLAQPGITVALVGARNPEQAVQNARTMNLKLTFEELDFIRKQLATLQPATA